MDKTVGMIERFAEEKSRKVDILHGDGTLFWAGGMRKGMEYVLDNGIISDHVLLINDDVKFFEQAIQKDDRYCCFLSGKLYSREQPAAEAEKSLTGASDIR